MSELKELLINISEEKQTKILPENLKAGVEAFGVAGNFTSDADATAADIAKDKTAYVNGEKVIGELEASSGGGNAVVKTTIQGNSSSSAPIGALSLIRKINEVVIMDGSCGDYIFKNCTNLEEITIDFVNTVECCSGFENCTSLKNATILNSNNITNFSGGFAGCTSMEQAPELNTSNALMLYRLFENCSNLKHVGVLNFSKLVRDNSYANKNMFAGCNNLTDESLNNILASCITAPSKYTDKTLRNMGLTAEQATKCQSLSNYAAFTAAGWTTGY